MGFVVALFALIDMTSNVFRIDIVIASASILSLRNCAGLARSGNISVVWLVQDDSIKMKGIEARRRDTPLWISRTQTELIIFLSQTNSLAELKARVPDLLKLLNNALLNLERGLVPVEELIVTVRLNRELENYHSPSPAARAARQLIEEGKVLHPGQKTRLIYTLGEPGVWAWDRAQTLNARHVNIKVYRELMLRAAETVFNPLGVSSSELRGMVCGGYQLPLFKRQV
jgi:DNA polymerase II